MPQSTKVVEVHDFGDENDPCGIYYAPPDRGFFVKAVAKDKVYKKAEEEREPELISGHLYSEGMDLPKKIEPVVIEKLKELQLSAKKERENDPIPAKPKPKTKAEKRKAKRKAQREKKRQEREVLEMFRSAKQKYETNKPKSMNKQWRKIKKEQKFEADIRSAIARPVPEHKQIKLGLSYADVIRTSTPPNKQTHYTYKTPPSSPKKLPKVTEKVEEEKEELPETPSLSRSISNIEDLPLEYSETNHLPLDSVEESNTPSPSPTSTNNYYDCDYCERLQSILDQSIPSEDQPVVQICDECMQEHLCCTRVPVDRNLCAKCDLI